MLGVGFTLSVCAGLCAALASCMAKLAMSGDEIEAACKLILMSDCTQVVPVLRGVSFISMFVLNGFMWTLFVKSLQFCQSSVQATITNSSANFFFTALLGRFLFGEVLSLKWWCGASLIVMGLLLIHRGSSKVELESKERKQR